MSVMVSGGNSAVGAEGVSRRQPGTDELVPSRYALQVGAIEVLVVSDGVIQIPAETMAPNADPDVRSA